jgi:hypothetical protein
MGRNGTISCSINTRFTKKIKTYVHPLFWENRGYVLREQGACSGRTGGMFWENKEQYLINYTYDNYTSIYLS